MRGVRSAIVGVVVSLGLCVVPCYAGSPPEHKQVSGVVQDSTGAVIVNAVVEFRSDKKHMTARTDASGQFRFDSAASTTGTISTAAPGFVTSELSWNGEQQVQIVLQPSSGHQQVLVSATRINAQLEDSPADSFAFSQNYLGATPALTLDDALKKVPGFTLFRRSSSRTANPSTQGVSMRGLGASGTSRALVLLDDVPLTDPFGGWVYWDRVARESISTIEVVRGGGAASLYGTTAMGGVVQFRTRQPEAPSVSMEGSWGNENTPEFSGWAGTRLGPWIGSLSTDLFRSNGYIIVPEDQRGSVDTPANSRHQLTSLDLGRHFGNHSQVFVRGSYFDEFRHNGTAIQTNATQIGDFSTGWNFDSASAGTISARLFGLLESYDQTFSSVAADRNTESLTNHQRVPSQALGGNMQWSRPVGRSQTLVAGFEMREVHGSSNEDLFRQSAGTTVPNGQNLSGGRERTARVFGEDIIQLGRLTANLSLGYDHWSDFDARRIHINTDGTFSLTQYPARSSDAVNPRAALLYRLGHGTSLTASGYRAFRAPTLNELYRSFRQGNVVTNNNPALRAERLTGVEGGIRQNFLSDRLNLRATFFWNDMTNTVVNVTLSTDPVSGLITRQKQNVGRTLSTGLNLDGEFRVTSNLQIAGGYQFAHAVVSAYTPDPNLGNPDLTGKWIPQVPHQQFTLQTRYVNPRILTATVQGTFSGQQFDDDLNNFPLDKYFSVDVYLARSLGKGFEGFIAGENIFNTRWSVAATPVTTLGPPILARVGLRYQFPKR
jgi:outer membrane receptor protein involved in Fe transport